MFPRLIQIGSFYLPTYGVILAIAYLVGIWLLRRKARDEGLPEQKIFDFSLYVLAAAILGAKALLVIVEWRHYVENPRSLVEVLRSGGVFYGGLIAATTVGIWYMKKHRLPAWKIADMGAPSIALGEAIGRWGCFAAGCCYGKQTTVPWAVVFTDPAAQANVGTPLGIPLHPTQLYESGAELLILIVLLATERRGRPFPGRTFWLYMVLYAISRYIIEFYRGDPRGFIFGFSTSQFISLLLAPLAIAMLIWLSRTTPETPQRMRGRRRLAA